MTELNWRLSGAGSLRRWAASVMRATLGWMNAQKLVEAAEEYRTILEARGIVAERVSDRDVERMLDDCNEEDRQVLLRHVLWICCHIPAMINRPSGQYFCFRWIGCVEGILIAYGFLSVDHVREQFRNFLLLQALEDELDALPRRL